MNDITDINEYHKNKGKVLIANHDETIKLTHVNHEKDSYKSCKTCVHYTLTKYNENRCMVFPLGDFHRITTEHCDPSDGKIYWYPKNSKKGLLTRLKEFLF